MNPVFLNNYTNINNNYNNTNIVSVRVNHVTRP